jgi:electron transport complex protein RnfC
MGFLDKLFAKHWGVHPQDYKRPAADKAVRILPLPAHLYVPLSQHVGAAARPVVVVGEQVLKGQLLAEAQGNISAPIHAPTSGRVAAIGEVTAPHTSGLPVAAIIIECDGQDRWADLKGVDDPFVLTPQDIAKRVAAAGIVGLGGATFPSSVKLTLGLRSKIDTLIINGSECEPYLSCDDRLMRDSAAEIIAGIRIMLHATAATQALVGIEDNKPEAITAMQAAASGFDAIRICPVPARYPMGSDRQLIVELTGREVPSDARAADVGVIVHNVGTARAVQQAVMLGRPMVTRLMTLNGALVAEPGNYEVPLGMLFDDIFSATGGLKGKPERLVMGGPLMGTLLPHGRIPVVKGTSGVLALSAAEVQAQEPQDCIRCSSCVKACPMGLLPLEMSARIRKDDLAGADEIGLRDCIACGCCAYVCPSRIPLVQYFYHAKSEMSAQGRSKLRQDATKKLAQARSDRLAREAREKAEAAAKRKAERDAAKKAAEAAAAQAATETPSAVDA